MSGAYAPDKALLHLDRLAAIKNGQVPVPVHVHISISDLCNQGCSFCAYRTPGYTELFAVQGENGQPSWNPPRWISTARLLRLMDEFAAMGVKAIQFTGGGEPTMHPDFAKVMRHAQARGLETALVTNGLRLSSDENLEVALRCTWVRVSIDHADAAGYSKMRHVLPDIFDRVVDNTRRLVELKRREGAPVVIGIGHVINKDNWRTPLDGALLARRLGVDNIRLSAVFQPDDAAYFKDFHDDAAALCVEAEQLTGNGFEVVNNFGLRIADLEQQRPNYRRCPYQYLTTFVGGDENIYRCCPDLL